MERRLKERAEHLVNIYINYRLSPSEDAGWHGDSTMSRLVEFKGDLPQSTGNDQADLKMINEICFIQNEHYELGQARRVIFSMGEKYRQAIFSAVVCRNRWYDTGRKMARCDDAYITASLKISSISAYRKRLQRAYEQIIEADNKTTRCCA